MTVAVPPRVSRAERPFRLKARLVDGLGWAAEAFDRERWLFSIKAFAAAMMALFIALSLDLAQPSWSVTTAYVVSQPLAGMVLSKALYRAIGTVIGAAASVVLIALLNDQPPLFLIALAAWIAIGAFITSYYRDAPQSYAATLAAFTAALVGLTAAAAPETVFNLAVARTEEILLGIASGTFVHHVIVPRTAGTALRAASHRALQQIAHLSTSLLSGSRTHMQPQELQALINSIFQIDSLRGFALLETPAARRSDSRIRLLRNKLFSMLALLVSLGDRIDFLRHRHPGLHALLRPTLEQTSAALQADPETDHADERGSTWSGPTVAELRADHDQFFVRSIVLRIDDLRRTWSEIVALDRRVEAEAPAGEFDQDAELHRFRDFSTAVLGGVTAFVAVLAASAFWIFTAWPSGATAVIFTAVTCTIMAPRDAPAKSAATFLLLSVVGAAIAAVYVLALLPRLDTFAELVIALAPFYLTAGLMLTSPKLLPLAMPMIFNGGALLGLSNAMSYDFAEFLNTAIAILAGTGFGALVLLLFHTPHQSQAIERLKADQRRDLLDLLRTDGAMAPRSFESHTFDRINVMLPRLDAEAAADRAILTGSLAGLRVGLNLIALNRLKRDLDSASLSRLDESLSDLRDALSGLTDWRAAEPVLIDRERQITAAIGGSSAEVQLRTAQALHAIRTTIAQHRAAFEPRRNNEGYTP